MFRRFRRVCLYHRHFSDVHAKGKSVKKSHNGQRSLPSAAAAKSICHVHSAACHGVPLGSCGDVSLLVPRKHWSRPFDLGNLSLRCTCGWSTDPVLFWENYQETGLRPLPLHHSVCLRTEVPGNEFHHQSVVGSALHRCEKRRVEPGSHRGVCSLQFHHSTCHARDTASDDQRNTLRLR